MTAAELRRRAHLFVAELGRADAMAPLDQRSATDGTLQDAFSRFMQRYASGSVVPVGPAFTQYADAFADARRTNIGGSFARDGAALMCRLCANGSAPTVVTRSPADVVAHVLTVTHLGRAKAAAARRSA